jgi:hypothetical protein
MVKRARTPPEAHGAAPSHAELPRPTLRFRLEAWRAFQRALDPLATPKPLRPPRRLH